jgi:predicted dehydrogenase
VKSLPEDTEEIQTAGGYDYPNSTGLIYEAAAVARCIAAGEKEVPQFTLAETLQTLKLIDEIRTQLEVESLPEDTEEIKTAGGYHYPNSTGFIYEAAAVARCIAAGKKEVQQFTLAETLQNLKHIKEVRTQLGVKPVVMD